MVSSPIWLTSKIRWIKRAHVELALPVPFLSCISIPRSSLFSFLQGRWQDMFNVQLDILLYDLTSTYFECDPPDEGKRRFGYSRDKRSDCIQVVIALIVTPDGFPLASNGVSMKIPPSSTMS